MSHRVWPVKSVERAIKGLDKTASKKFKAAVEQLKGEGCRAGGKRLRDPDGSDSPYCQLDVARNLRLVTAYPADGSVVLIGLGPHEGEESAAADLAELLPDVSATGRKRSAQPPCCDDLGDPPELSEEQETLLGDVFKF